MIIFLCEKSLDNLFSSSDVYNLGYNGWFYDQLFAFQINLFAQRYGFETWANGKGVQVLHYDIGPSISFLTGFFQACMINFHLEAKG